MNDAVKRALERISRAPGVRGAMVVDGDAGVPVAAELAEGVEEMALAAMANALYRRTADASASAGFGGVRTLQVDTAAGHVVVAGAGALLVVGLTDGAAQLGLVRVEAARAAEELA